MDNINPLILANIVAAHCQQHPHLDVLTFVHITKDGTIDEEIHSYQQLWDNGQYIAAALDQEGMQQGDTFALLMQNHPEFVDAMVGASITNTVFVPIDPRTRGEKLAYMLNFSGCRGVIVADYALEKLAQITDQLPCLEWVWILDSNSIKLPRSLPGQRLLTDIFSGPVPNLALRANDPEAPMQMLYTSGTTGDPKAIVAPHIRFGRSATLGPLFGLKTGDRPYTGLSLTHANAQMITLGMGLLMGLRTVISRKFTKSRLWDITRRYGCTSFNLLGGMTNAIYSEPVRPNDGDNPVRFVLSAGMPASLWDSFRQRFDVEIFEFYGAAEGGITLNPPNIGPKGSIGKPLPSLEARIVDEHDHECAPGESGEIVFRAVEGPPLAVRYYKNPEASERKTAGGWLRMGDIGYRDEHGWLYFLYRMGGGIRRNGDFIDPAVVEKILAEHPIVEDVFVYGVAAFSGTAGEKDLVAALVISQGRSFDESELLDYCHRQMQSNYVPSYLQIVDEIPKTASEKPQERFLLEQFESNRNNIIYLSNEA
jgi:crotonobetaine/carnitine-CoA ligase